MRFNPFLLVWIPIGAALIRELWASARAGRRDVERMKAWRPRPSQGRRAAARTEGPRKPRESRTSRGMDLDSTWSDAAGYGSADANSFGSDSCSTHSSSHAHSPSFDAGSGDSGGSACD